MAKHKGVPLPELPRNGLNLAVYDIECAELYSHDMIFMCGIKPLGGEAYIVGIKDVPKPKHGDLANLDSNLLLEVKRHLEHYDGLIGWNCRGFDLPMINDRLVMQGEKRMRDPLHLDLMKQVKWPKSRTRRMSLDFVSRQFGCPYKKHYDEDGVIGHMRARNEIVADVAAEYDQRRRETPHYADLAIHCMLDLQITEWMFGTLKPGIRQFSRRVS